LQALATYGEAPFWRWLLRVTRLDIENFRVIREASVDTDAPLVILMGENASGKTTFLESLSALLAGRSFRTRYGRQLISQGAEGYLVRGALVAENSKMPAKQHLAAQLVSSQSPQFRLNGEDVRPARLVRRFPLQIVDASIFDLVEGGPVERRKFFDWGMFHVKHEFYPLWKKHRKLVSYWNRLLREGRSSELNHWKPALVDVSEAIAQMRRAHLVDLQAEFASPAAAEMNDRLFGGQPELRFQQGWSADKAYAAALEESLARDLREGRLRQGAHRFDLSIRLDGSPVKDTFSRGQKKLLGLKLKLAQIRLYNAQPDRPCCVVLVDDLAAEVDQANQKIAISEILSAGSQVFLTTVDQSWELAVPSGADKKMFHVKQGVITELI